MNISEKILKDVVNLPRYLKRTIAIILDIGICAICTLIAFYLRLEEFIKMIVEKNKPKVNFEDGRRALILANAAYESLNTGKVVDIKFE